MATLEQVINSPMLWAVSSLMVIVILGQAIWYLSAALKEAKNLGIPMEDVRNGMRSAMITAVGPSLGLVIVLLSLVALLGAPTTWMRLNDIGSGRTEVTVTALACNILGVNLGSGGLNLQGFALALWAMALNNFGWLIVALLCTGSMASIVEKMNAKYDPLWTKLIMNGTTFGIFAYLWINSIWKKKINNYSVAAVVIAAITILLIDKFFGKNQRMQELSIGIAMVVGMFGANALKHICG
ncbi:MAG: DUF5058 family protein [Phascolarctobacterium sp.]|nr:DUF5058 family protein [Phascolarctobacterium sp.]